MARRSERLSCAVLLAFPDVVTTEGPPNEVGLSNEEPDNATIQRKEAEEDSPIEEEDGDGDGEVDGHLFKQGVTRDTSLTLVENSSFARKDETRM